MKHALIIGASGDIGQAIVEKLAAQGWSLYLHGFRNMSRLEQLLPQLQQRYPQQDFILVRADFTKPEKLDQLTSQLFSVDAVIFAEGITYYSLFQELSAEKLNQLWQIHVGTPLLLLQKLQAKLAQQHWGRVIFIGSIYGGVGSAMEVAYSTVKGAQSAFVNAYAREVGSLGITVNVVAPGAVATQMNQIFSPEEKSAVTAEIPVGRFAQPSEIAYFVSSLLVPEAGYFTGQTLYVDGGWLK